MSGRIWIGFGSVIIIAILSWYAIGRFDVPRTFVGLVAGLAALGLAVFLVYWTGRSSYR